MTPPEHTQIERIVALESEVKGIKGDLAEMKPLVRETHTRVTQWGGIATGIAIAVSTIWAGLIGLWSLLKHKLG